VCFEGKANQANPSQTVEKAFPNQHSVLPRLKTSFKASQTKLAQHKLTGFELAKSPRHFSFKAGAAQTDRI
jgi:hypothetical protein